MATKSQIIAFKTLIGKAGLQHEEENMLSGYNAQSVKDLTDTQAAELIDWLSKRDKPESDEALRKARSRVLGLLTKLGYDTTSRAGWSHINEFVAQPRIAGRRMYDLDIDELDALYKKLHLFINRKRDKDLEIKRLEINN